MRKHAAAAVIALMATAFGLSTAIADDWTTVRLRGGVFALENGAWTQLLRGSVVPDDRVIKSAPGGRITLVRGAETIELGSDTTAQISDRDGFTTVYNHEGTVGVDAEARNVQHFAVQTPFLAAVVKGTAFTVQTSPTASTVTVARGTVEVDDDQNNTSVNVIAGQQVSSSEGTPITATSIVAAPPSAPEPPAPAAQQPRVTPSSTNAIDTHGGAPSAGIDNVNDGGKGNGGAGSNDRGNSKGNGNGNGNGNKDNAGGGGEENNGGGGGKDNSGGDGGKGNSNGNSGGNGNSSGNGNSGNSGNSGSGNSGHGNGGNGNSENNGNGDSSGGSEGKSGGNGNSSSNSDNGNDNKDNGSDGKNEEGNNGNGKGGGHGKGNDD